MIAVQVIEDPAAAAGACCGKPWPEDGSSFGELSDCAGGSIVREVSDLIQRATEAGKSLATLAVDSEIRFRSPSDRTAFTKELSEAITSLVAKYHDASAPGGRPHRLVVIAHPAPESKNPKV